MFSLFDAALRPAKALNEIQALSLLQARSQRH
jgi:hypothetical protein